MQAILAELRETKSALAQARAKANGLKDKLTAASKRLEARETATKGGKRMCTREDLSDRTDMQLYFLASHGINPYAVSTLFTARSVEPSYQNSLTSKRSLNFLHKGLRQMSNSTKMKFPHLCDNACQTQARAMIARSDVLKKALRKNVRKVDGMSLKDLKSKKVNDTVCLSNLSPEKVRFGGMAQDSLSGQPCRGSCCNKATGYCSCRKGCADGEYLPFFAGKVMRARLYKFMDLLTIGLSASAGGMCSAVPDPQMDDKGNPIKNWFPGNFVPLKSCEKWAAQSKIQGYKYSHGLKYLWRLPGFAPQPDMSHYCNTTYQSKYANCQRHRHRWDKLLKKKQKAGTNARKLLGRGAKAAGSLKNQMSCKTNAECKSRICKGNLGGIKRGKCSATRQKFLARVAKPRSVKNGRSCTKNLECISGICKGNLHGLAGGKCSATRITQDVVTKVESGVKNAAVKAVSFFLKKIFRGIRIHIPCNVRPQVMYVMETLINAGKLDIKAAQKAAKATWMHIAMEMIPASINFFLVNIIKLPRAATTIQKVCQGVRMSLGCGQVARVVATPAELGGEAWRIFPKPDQFTFFIAKAHHRYFRDQPGTSSAACILPDKVKGCKTAEIMLNSSQKNTADCVVQFTIKMKTCNTCCCKNSGTIESSILSKLRYETDSDEKAVSNYNSRCWRGTFPYRKEPTSYMKSAGSACYM